MGTIQAEKEYRWLEAAKSYEQSLSTQTCKASDAETLEKIGYCYNLASRQTSSAEDFATLRKLAVKAYEGAARLHKEELTSESDGKNAMCLALSEYAASWLSPSSSEKRRTLAGCHSLAQEAYNAFEKLGNKLGYSKTCTILSQCLLDLVLITEKAEEKTRIVQEGLQFASEAISILPYYEEYDNLVNALSVASLLSWHFANLSQKEEERKEYAQRCLSYAENALVLSKRSANQHSSALSLWVKALSTFYFEEELEASMEYAKEMLNKADIVNDNYLRGVACYLIAYIYDLMVFKEEDTDKLKQLHKDTIEYCKAAIRHFHLVSQDSNIAEAYLFYVEASLFLSKEPTTDKEERLTFSKQAMSNGEEGLVYARRSGSVDAVFDSLHALSKAYQNNAKLEKDENQKLQLLKKALTYRKECDKIAEQSFEFNYWLIGNGLIYSAQIESDLASLETDDKTKTDLLAEALRDIENGVSNSNKWLTTSSMPSLVGIAADYENTYGGMLSEHYEQTHEKENLTRANKTFNDAANKFREVDLPSRVGESYWRIARNLDISADYIEAAENFEKAFAGYKSAATKIPQFSEFFLGYASYMRAWSEIEMAKRAHSDEKYAIAKDHYEKSSQLLRQSKTWMYLSLNFYAWALIEHAEDLSRKENSKESIDTFQQAIRSLQESKRVISLKLESIDKKDEKDLAKRLIQATEIRSQYSLGRIAIEEAKILTKQGDQVASSEKYIRAAAIFQEISLETGEAAKEAKPLLYLCQAWQKMALAEARSNPTMYREAADLFKQANEHSLKESTGLMALGHSSFCEALEAGTKFETNPAMETYEQATRHMEKAENYYRRAGFEITSEYAKATQRLFDAHVFMESAKRERDPNKQARFYSMAEDVLKRAAECFTKAGRQDKIDQVQRLLTKVREKRELALSLGDIFNAPEITTSPATFSTITSSQETPAGLERFEKGDIQAKLVQHESEAKTGDIVELEIQIVNVGKEPVSLIKIQNITPAGFQLIEKPDYCLLENEHLSIKGKKLNPLKTEELKITLKAYRIGTVEIKPRIICVDSIGNQVANQPEPAIYNISATILPNRVPTGHTDLDTLLFGGIIENYAVILASPAIDERELLIKRFIETGAKNGDTTYCITSETGNIADLAENIPSNFTLFLCNPRVETMIENPPNIFKLKGAENLTDIDIALIRSFRNLDSKRKGPKRICITILSDVLLQHHAVVTRKWLGGLLADLKARNFTVLAVINPEMHPSEEYQAVLGLFEGEIRIVEKETDRGLERLLRIRRLSGQRYLDNEISLKRETLEC